MKQIVNNISDSNNLFKKVKSENNSKQLELPFRVENKFCPEDWLKKSHNIEVSQTLTGFKSGNSKIVHKIVKTTHEDTNYPVVLFLMSKEGEINKSTLEEILWNHVL